MISVLIGREEGREDTQGTRTDEDKGRDRRDAAMSQGDAEKGKQGSSPRACRESVISDSGL